ncbi:hypothetical protein [Mesotoga sp.]|uniref:hypothetical protein n=1 Tax=Mesotoga sp. TaxID=2053577 RepID=UPI00345E4AE7
MMGKITKSTIAAGFASIVLLLSGCPLLPPPNNAPTLDPKQTSITINEAQNLFLEGKVSDDNSSLDQILFEVSSDRFAFSSVEKTLPDNFSIEGSPKDKNYYGSTHMEISATDHNGARITFRIPITVKDTPDLVVTDWPTSIEVDKGQTFQITFKLTDDYSDWYNGIAKSFVCDKYNIAFEAINATDGRLTFTPKDPGYVGTTDFEATFSDDEGNTVDRSLEIIVNDVANSKPTIEIPDFTIKEGENKDITVKITDEDPLSQLEVAVSSDKYNVSYQKVNDTDLLITFTKLNDDYNGPAGITVQATDTQNLSEKVTKTFQVTPMTDLELKILGQTLNVSGGIVVGSQISNQSNVNVKVYQRDVNWMEKEEYGDLYHYRIGIDSALGELLFQGTTNSQGSIKFQVDPKAYDEALLYVVLGKSGFLDKTRHFFGDTDLGSTSLILSQDNPLINEWLYYSLCNNGYQPLDGTAYIPKSNVTWPHLVFPNYPRPDVAIIIPEGEYVSQEVLDAIPEAVEHVFGPGMNIFQTSDKGEIKDNRIAIMFTDVGGSGWVSKYALSNLIGSAGIYVRREFVDNNYTVYEIIHELGHDLFCNAHKENMDSHYSNLGYDFSTYPYFTGADKAVQQLVLAVGNMLPGDKYVYEGKFIKTAKLLSFKRGQGLLFAV